MVDGAIRGLQEPAPDGLLSADPLAGLGRRLPHNLEAEISVLGAMLVHPKAAGRVLQHLDDPAAFALLEHQQIFACLRKLHLRGKPTDCVSAKSYLPDGVSRETIGVMVDSAVTPGNAAEYARQIKELWLRRQWIAVGDEIAQGAYDLDQETLVPPESLEQIDALRWQRSSGIEGLEKYEFGQLHLVKAPPIDPLLGGWLHRQSRAFVTGAKKTGKSFLTMEIARAVGLGLPFLHWSGSGKPTRVLYVDGELGLAACQKREEDFRRKHGDAPMNVTFLHFDIYPVPPVDTIAGHQMILNAADQVKAGLVIIDNYTALTDESLSDDVTVKRIRPLLNELMHRRIASISVAHAGHNEARFAGSHVMSALTTGILHLTRDDESPAQHCFGSVTWQATREARPDDPDYNDFAYEIQDGSFVVREAAEGRRKMPEKQSLRWALEQLSQCLHNRGQVLCGNAVRPNGMSAVETRTFREWLMRRGETTEIECQRTIKDLIVGGWICKDGDWIWRV